MTITLPYFGEIDLDHLKTYYQTSVEIDGKTIQLDINTQDNTLEPQYLEALLNYLNNIPNIIDIAKKAVDEDFNTESNVLEFLAFHIEEFNEEDIEKILVNADPSLSIEEQLLSATFIKRIGFYPHTDDYFAIVDYSFGEKFSQYVLVVKMNPDYGIEEITYES